MTVVTDDLLRGLVDAVHHAVGKPVEPAPAVAFVHARRRVRVREDSSARAAEFGEEVIAQPRANRVVVIERVDASRSRSAAESVTTVIAVPANAHVR